MARPVFLTALSVEFSFSSVGSHIRRGTRVVVEFSFSFVGSHISRGTCVVGFLCGVNWFHGVVVTSEHNLGSLCLTTIRQS